MALVEVAFLGPEGTFSHLVAQKRFGAGHFSPLASVKEVFKFAASNSQAVGVVPIENSSGGTIYDTVDRLVDESNGLFIHEALSLNVKLALLGSDRARIKEIYSHFAPLNHCEKWLQRVFPEAQICEVASTAKAVKAAVENPEAAAIGTRDAARIYNLDVLEFPIANDIPNVTQFFVIGQPGFQSDRKPSKTTLAVKIPNEPGSLVDFLQPFKSNGINLTRIISRPITGEPNTYIFLIDLAAAWNAPIVQSALQAQAPGVQIRLIGSYPVREPFEC